MLEKNETIYVPRELEEKYYAYLSKCFDEAIEIIKSVIGEDDYNYEMQNMNIQLDIIYDSSNTLGLCHYIDDFYCIISIYWELLKQENYKDLIETIIHEILHAFKSNYNHDFEWYCYANLITENTPFMIDEFYEGNKPLITGPYRPFDAGWLYE